VTVNKKMEEFADTMGYLLKMGNIDTSVVIAAGEYYKNPCEETLQDFFLATHDQWSRRGGFQPNWGLKILNNELYCKLQGLNTVFQEFEDEQPSDDVAQY